MTDEMKAYQAYVQEKKAADGALDSAMAELGDTFRLRHRPDDLFRVSRRASWADLVETAQGATAHRVTLVIQRWCGDDLGWLDHATEPFETVRAHITKATAEEG